MILPEEDVVEAFQTLSEKIDFPEESFQLIDYFERNWIGRGIRQKPLYPPDVWNYNYAVKHKLPRNNNSVEGWYKGFNEPSIWPFFDAIKNKIQKIHWFTIKLLVETKRPLKYEETQL